MLARVFQKIFGLSAPLGEIAKFGSLNAGTPEFTNDASLVQSYANWIGGWKAAVMGGNSPALEDMNAFCFLNSYQLAYLFEKGIPEWDIETTYEINSLVVVSGVTYQSKTAANVGNAVTASANWRRYSPELCGVMKDFLGATLPEGFVFASGKTIGDAASGSTERANADTLDLFTMLWADYSNALLPIYDSAGVLSARVGSAAADFALHKRITVPDLRGRVAAGKDNMGGVSANRLTIFDGDILGNSGGEEGHVLTANESGLVGHAHTASAAAAGLHHHAEWSNGANGELNPGIAVNGAWILPPNAAPIANQWRIPNPMEDAGSHAHAITVDAVAAAAAAAAHNNVQPTFIVNKIIKL